MHSHSCSKGGYRCHKRVDVNGETIFRTPPYPQSHHLWIMEIEQQYPEEVMRLLGHFTFC